MKKVFLFAFLIAIVSTALVSCTNEHIDENEQLQEQSLPAAIEDGEISDDDI